MTPTSGRSIRLTTTSGDKDAEILATKYLNRGSATITASMFAREHSS
jgi:hypothetical protein